jgi:hypothetical protein
MKANGKLKISISRDDGGTIVYKGEAEWRTDQVLMQRVSGRPLDGYDENFPGDLEFHAAMIRSAALEKGMDTEETWSGEFAGGRER